MEYKYNLTNYKNKLSAMSTSRRITNQLHQVVLHFYAGDQHDVKFNLDAYKNQDKRLNPNTTFGDVMYRYAMKKKKIDFELSAYSLFYEKYFCRIPFLLISSNILFISCDQRKWCSSRGSILRIILLKILKFIKDEAGESLLLLYKTEFG